MVADARETQPSWLDFLRSPARRGLRGVQCVISDAHERLEAVAARRERPAPVVPPWIGMASPQEDALPAGTSPPSTGPDAQRGAASAPQRRDHAPGRHQPRTPDDDAVVRLVGAMPLGQSGEHDPRDHGRYRRRQPAKTSPPAREHRSCTTSWSRLHHGHRGTPFRSAAGLNAFPKANIIDNPLTRLGYEIPTERNLALNIHSLLKE